MARSVSSSEASETRPTVEPSAGQVMVRVSPLWAASHLPLMNRDFGAPSACTPFSKSVWVGSNRVFWVLK